MLLLKWIKKNFVDCFHSTFSAARPVGCSSRTLGRSKCGTQLGHCIICGEYMNFSESTVGSGTVAWDETKDPHVWEDIGGDDGARVGPHIERVPPRSLTAPTYLSTMETRSCDFGRRWPHWQRIGKADGF